MSEMAKREKTGLPESERRPELQPDFPKNPYDEYTKRYLSILDEYKAHIERSLIQKHNLKNRFLWCLCLVLVLMMVMCGCITCWSFGIFDKVIDEGMPSSSTQSSQPDDRKLDIKVTGQKSNGAAAELELSVSGEEKQNAQSGDSFTQTVAAVIGAISAMISAYASLVAAVLKLPEIVANYLYNQHEDDNMTKILEGIQKYELESKKLRNSGNTDGVLAREESEDNPGSDDPLTDPPQPTEQMTPA